MAYHPHAPNSRVRVEETPAGTRITLRGTAQWLPATFLGFWLCGWFVGEVFAIGALLSGNTPGPARAFLLLWLAGWTLGGLAAIRHLLASVSGIDVILLGPDGPRLGKRVLGFERLRPVDLASLLGARAIRGIGKSVWLILPPSGGHRVARIGAGLDAHEAEQVVTLVREWAEREERLAGRAPRNVPSSAVPSPAPSASSAPAYLFYRPMELPLNRRGEDADAKGERSVGGRTQGR